MGDILFFDFVYMFVDVGVLFVCLFVCLFLLYPVHAFNSIYLYGTTHQMY